LLSLRFLTLEQVCSAIHHALSPEDQEGSSKTKDYPYCILHVLVFIVLLHLHPQVPPLLRFYIVANVSV